MTYPFKIEKLIQTDDQKNWAHECTTSAMSLVLTARLALENDEGGICRDVERIAVVADTLAIAYALMLVAADGVDLMQREGPYGPWKHRAENRGADA
ncbi:MAG: hypothetical protein ABNH17_07385 [Paracoccus sp. (in: a-proteobacteria)]|jgi:hypothetical protein|uniref:hypothetical protein n=1 Tax=Paracoccus sp. TaxID=267 RepID=UPI0032D8E8B4